LGRETLFSWRRGPPSGDSQNPSQHPASQRCRPV